MRYLCLHERLFLSEQLGLALTDEPMKEVTPSTTERQSSSCSNLSRSHQCQADCQLNHGLFTVTSSNDENK